jgi:4-amino-4-deoxy-L-arabinose transferase
VQRRSLLLGFLAAVLLAAWAVGLFARGFWTPDEPREADIAWRMSWQADRAVPLLAGDAFCEKPPFTYWVAAGAIRLFGESPGTARLPNLLYALIAALATALLARRAAGPIAGAVAAAAIGSFLLSYQVAIWLATDAPLLAAVALALLGEFIGFYATSRRERLRGYLLMHAALGVGFLCKSAAALMVPALAFCCLIVWERRFRELLRWELWLTSLLQLLIVGAWIFRVYVGSDGPAHLQVFFWNNLIGRVTAVAAPAELQYASAHRNSPGKYLIELPIYLWPWTLLVVAAVRRAWRERAAPADSGCPAFAAAVFLPTLLVLSFAATARNIYLAPALPGLALLLGWWGQRLVRGADRWDVAALRGTAVLLFAAAAAFGIAAALAAVSAEPALDAPWTYTALSVAGIGLAAYLFVLAWRAIRRGRGPAALAALFAGYCVLLVAPASQVYGVVDRGQDLAALGAALRVDLGSRPLVLLAPDETTRAWVDMYARTNALRILGPIDASALDRLDEALAEQPRARALVQLEGRELSGSVRAIAAKLGLELQAAAPDPDWLRGSRFGVVGRYALPNGRRYVLLAVPERRFALTPRVRGIDPRID